ncbi:unnamed protein product [Bursaphelenchus okinawaensis]|uniref:Phospholipid/glycerol acyltransferase domain-containing protein n=1 Tax=Bursaphelenchus okinawaensis TaxID=465554 RepID=A0A811L186_9BILA|nr:unnamed protein product [Bursaphelenchus okinawaensis]CAG9114267.1 unnamed protein product [Bursaphelenchus okinawaensis]
MQGLRLRISIKAEVEAKAKDKAKAKSTAKTRAKAMVDPEARAKSKGKTKPQAQVYAQALAQDKAKSEAGSKLKAIANKLKLSLVKNEYWNFSIFPGTESATDLAVYALSCFIRYGILFPIRLQLLIFASAFIGLAGIVSYIKPYTQRQRLYCCSVYARSFSASMGLVATYHNRENVPRAPGVAMANHLTANDIQYMFADLHLNVEEPQGYTVTGQLHKGIIGYIIKMSARIAPIYFLDRSKPEERKNFQKNVVEAARTGKLDPVLLFPEGYCSNNTGVMQMRKAAFEEGINVYPIAIKQHAILGDSFWNEPTFLPYIFRVMASWCINYDVYYLPKQQRQPTEDGEQFAARIQKQIADKIGVPAVPFGGTELYRVKRMCEKLNIK